jgi:cytochrome c2
LKRAILYAVVGAAIFGAGLAIGGLRASRERLIELYGDIVAAVTPSSPADYESEEKVEVINTALVNFNLRWINPDTPLPQEGGGMVAVEDGVLIARPAEGALLFLSDSTRSIERLALRLPPLNRDKLPNRTLGGKRIEDRLHRYNDLEIVDVAGSKHLVVAYDYYYPERKCFVSRLAAIALPEGWRRRADFVGEQWKIVFETKPCIGFFEGPRHAVGSHQSGGRLAYAPDGKLYMTVGDYEVDGLDGRLPAYPQVEGASYGKIWRFDPATWTPELVSMGHRNPQGITALPDGSIWSVEHGPQGGDELNHIVAGRNYGWPHVTLGVNYTDVERDDKYWPFNASQGRHQGFEPPVYSWVPSIAVSNLKYIRNLDPRWDGDLLLGTINGLSLYRLRMSEGHVLYQEQIKIGLRIRYVEVAHGNIYLLTDSGLVGIMTPHKMTEQHVKLGQVATTGTEAASPLDQNGCVACHSNPALPKLSEVFGAEIASQENVDYSKALLAVDSVWDEQNLRAFLTNPGAFAPGSTMPSPGLSEDALNSVIAALREK